MRPVKILGKIILLSILSFSTLVQADDSVVESGYVVRDTTREFDYNDPGFDLEAEPYRVSLFDPQSGEDKERLWSQTKLIVGLGFGVAGAISLLPEEISGWEGDGDSNLFGKWWDNVSEGPVWDKDDWWINYVGHPYFGGVYYQVARKSGYRQWDSFVYAALMSTFYWEYGLEAFAEVPSIQDLIVTPVVGSFYGEWAFQQEKRIRQRGGTVMGSKGLGSVSLFFLDPVDAIGSGVNHLFGKEVIKAGTVWFSPQPAAARGMSTQVDSDFAINMALQF